MPSPVPATLWPTFVLLFAVTPDAAAGHNGAPAGVEAIPADVAAAYRDRIEGLQQRLLGEPYLQARRLSRRSIGRLALPGGALEPPYADIHLVEHKSGAAVWEVWLAAPPQLVDPVRWAGWLDMESAASLARQVWERLAPTHAGPEKAPELMLPLAVLRYRDGDLGELVERHADELIKLLHRDVSPERFKARFVRDELAGDFCRREQGLSLIARNAAIDVHAQPGASAHESDDGPLPRNTLPLLVTLELLCLERAVLRSFLDRFARGVYGTIDDLVQLRRDIFDGLEEYYGTLAKTHGYTAEATARGEVLFGIDDLFDSVVDRLEALTFEITTRSQRTVSQLGFWLTTSFGAIETGFVAASIATWYYASVAGNLGAVLGWTLGVTLATALLIAGLLRRRLNP
jgi:hypothetical protein